MKNIKKVGHIYDPNSKRNQFIAKDVGYIFDPMENMDIRVVCDRITTIFIFI